MNRRILKLAVPNIISNLSVPLLGMADMAIVGHIKGASLQIGAVAIGGMIFSFIYMTLSFLRSGTAGLTAQAFGQKNNSEITHIFTRAGILALSLAAFLILMQIPIERLSFWLLKGEQEVESLAQAYFKVRIWAAPATLLLYVFNGWFIGLQNSKVPMYVAVISNLTNILLNYIMVYIFDLGAQGVALGTLLSQYLALLIFVVISWAKYPDYIRFINFKASINKSKIYRLLAINRDLFIRSVLLFIVLSFFTASSASESTGILAVNSLLFQFFLLFSFFMDGFAYAGEALTGRYIGEKNPQGLQQTVKYLFLWGLMLSIPFTFLYIFANEPILRVLTNDAGIIHLAHRYTFWVCLLPLVSFASFLWDGVFIGATAGKAIRNTMAIAVLLIFAPIYIVLKIQMPVHALWLSFTLFMAARGILLTIWYKRAVLKQAE